MHAVNPSASSTSRRDPALDGLRGLAVLMVYVFHYGGGLRSPHLLVRFFGHITESGWTGVTLFFALSGFLITGSLWDSRGQKNLLRNFFARRALRILPLYYFAITACLVLALGHGTTFSDDRDFFIYYFFLQDLPVLATRVQALFTPLFLYHLWSLAVEEQFYLIWPFLLLHSHTRRAAMQLALTMFGLSVVFAWIVYGIPVFATRTPNSFDQFALTHAGALGLGAALAIAARSSLWSRVQQAAPLALGIAVVVFALSGLISGTFTLSHRLQFTVALPAASVAAAALVALALQPGRTRSALGWRPLAWLGTISYGFYVFHILLEPAFDGIGTHVTHATQGSAYQIVRFLVGFPITTLVAWISFHFLELPFLHGQRRYPMHRPLPASVLPPEISA